MVKEDLLNGGHVRYDPNYEESRRKDPLAEEAAHALKSLRKKMSLAQGGGGVRC